MSNKKKLKAKNSTYKNYKKEWISPIDLAAPVFVLGIIPLMLGLHIYDCGFEEFVFFPDSEAIQYDFYLYAKMTGVYAALVIIAAAILFRLMGKRRLPKTPKVFMLPAAAGLLALISAAFGGHARYAFTGSYDMFVSVIAVIGFLVICWYCYLTLDSDKKIEYTAKAGGIFVAVLLVIGVFQAFGLDFFQTRAGLRALAGVFHQDIVSLMSNSPDLMNITLSHADNVSGYLALLIPLTASMIFFLKRKWEKILAGVFLLCEVIVAIGIDTASVKLASAGTVIAAALIFASRNRRILMAALGVLAAALAAFIIAAFGNQAFGQKLYDIFVYPLPSMEANIASLYTGDDEVVFTLKDGNELHISYTPPEGADPSDDEYANGIVDAADADGAATECVYTLRYDEEFGVVISVTLDDLVWDVVYGTDGTYSYLTAASKLAKITEGVEKAAVFPDGLFTTRGEIWNKAILMLPRHILIGCGANCFGWELPQDDYVEDKYNAKELLYDVKCHNYYLNTAIEEGAAALVCILIFLGIYLVSSMKLYARLSLSMIKDRPVIAVGAACMISCIWYLINGLANDSYIGVAPIFWGMIGMGMAINKRVKHECDDGK